jgi:hypothetical protein
VKALQGFLLVSVSEYHVRYGRMDPHGLRFAKELVIIP